MPRHSCSPLQVRYKEGNISIDNDTVRGRIEIINMFQPPERRENLSTLPVLNQQAENIENHYTGEGIRHLS